MQEVSMKDVEFNLHNVIVAYTTPPEYEMNRYFLLQNGWRKYIVIDGYHCSCYDFDDTDWTAIEYTEEELETLSKADYNLRGDARIFWEQVRTCLGVSLEGEAE